MLSRLVEGEKRPILTPQGEGVKAAFLAAHGWNAALTMSDFVIMPDHVHFLLIVDFDRDPGFDPISFMHRLRAAATEAAAQTAGGLAAPRTHGPLREAASMDADTFAKRLLGRVVTDAKTLGASASKNILGMVYDRDLEVGLMATEKTSLTRQFACLILEQKVEDAMNLVCEDYNTGILVEVAEDALDGKDERVQAIKDDALKMAGDDSYQIDIGV